MTHRVPNVRQSPTSRLGYDLHEETWLSLLIGRSMIVGVGCGLISVVVWVVWKMGSLLFV